MPQLFTLYPDLTASENVDFVASLFGMLWLRRRRRVAEVLKIVDLWDARRRRASRLSGGMQRRLELACALVHEPALLFLDEPTAGIDPLLRARRCPRAPLPRGADRGHRSPAPRPRLGGAPPAAGRGPHARRHDPVRQRGR